MLGQQVTEQPTAPLTWSRIGQLAIGVNMVGVKHIQRCDQCRQAKRKASLVSWPQEQS